MAESLEELASLAANEVSRRRLLEETYRFISVPSPTGSEGKFAALFRDTLSGLGLESSLDEEFPNSPSVVARLPGSGGGPTLQLDGHTDTVPVPHDPPSLDLARDLVRGRGAADMKGGLAAICEAIRALKAAGLRPRGDVLVTAHGLHEAPLGDQRTIRSLLARKVAGEAAIIAELGHADLATSSRGMSIYTISVERAGTSMHEVEWADQAAQPIDAVRLLLNALAARAEELAAEPAQPVGRESLFVGEVRSGDFYNRVPTDAKIIGTRRYRAPVTKEDVLAELQELCDVVGARTGLSVEVDLKEVGSAYALDSSEPVIAAVQASYRNVVGAELPLAAAQAVGNATDFAAFGVPAVYHGVNQQTAHSDDEHVFGADLERAARVIAGSIIHFCGAGDNKEQR